MRKSLIGQTLGKRGSIGTKSLAKSLAPTTPRPEARRKQQQQQQQQSSPFDFAEEGTNEERVEGEEYGEGEEDFD